MRRLFEFCLVVVAACLLLALVANHFIAQAAMDIAVAIAVAIAIDICIDIGSLLDCDELIEARFELNDVERRLTLTSEID